MKSITLITIGLLLLGAVTPALAQDSARIADLEAKVKMLETQNLSLKAAVEKISGNTLGELLTDQSAVGGGRSAAMPEATTVKPAPDPAKVAAIAELKARIASAEKTMVDEAKAAEKAAKDPFGKKGGVSLSKADAEKKRGLQMRVIAEMKQKLSAMEAE